MHHFIDGPPSWPFTRQVVWNNHPLFSFVGALVADATGSTSETTMRIAPAIFSALAAAVLTWRVGRRLSWPAGLAGGVVIASHPLMLEIGREVRGYSLAVLAVTVVGIAVLDVHSPVLFGAASFVAVGTHLHAAIPVATLLAYLLVTRRFDRRWRVSAMVASLGVLVVYAGTIAQSGRGDSRLFRPTFLRDSLWELLGRTPFVVVTLGGLAVIGFASVSGWRNGRWVLPVVPAVGLVVVWLVAPFDLYTRFIYWALPALALLVAVAVRRYPRALALVVAVAASNLVVALPQMRTDQLPNRALVEAAGADACVIGGVPEYMSWYADKIVIGEQCPRGLVPPEFYPAALVARAFAVWPVRCRAIGGGEVRAVSAAACPGGRSGG